MGLDAAVLEGKKAGSFTENGKTGFWPSGRRGIQFGTC